MMYIKKNVLILIYVFILFVSLTPFYLWKYQTIVHYVVALGCFIWGLWKRPVGLSLWAFLFVCLFYIYATLYQYKTNINGMVMTLLPLLVFLINTSYWPKIYEKFFFLYSVTLIPSLIVYFLVFWIGVNIPFHYLDSLNKLKDYQYLVYPFLVSDDHPVSFIRFCGYYDEAGVVGTVSGVLLIINNINLKDWKNYPLLLSGIFSFSLFFYALISLYILFWGNLKMKVIVVIAIIVFAVLFLSTDNPFVDLIYDRVIEKDNYGINRTGSTFDSFWNKYYDSDMFWIGYGHNYANLVADPGGSSYTHLVVDYGIIMFLLYTIAFLLYYVSLKLSPRNLFLLFFVFISVIYQRPFIFSLFYLFLLLAPASVMKSKQMSNHNA